MFRYSNNTLQPNGQVRAWAVHPYQHPSLKPNALLFEKDLHQCLIKSKHGDPEYTFCFAQL